MGNNLIFYENGLVLKFSTERLEVDAVRGAAKSRKNRRYKGKNTRRKFLHRSGVTPPISADHEEVLFGALDLGTNNCRLLIAVATESGFEVRDAFSRIVRLGEGLSHSGMLSEQAMQRTVEALRVCANKLKWHKVALKRLIATEACRMASNGEAFIARIAQETGLTLEIIDRETEAHLAAAGAGPLMETGAENAVVFDIGGGSTEIMWVEQQEGQRQILAWDSLPAGVVTLSEKYGGGKDVTRQSYALMCAHVQPLLAAFVKRVAEIKGGGPVPTHLLGTSGTITTIAGVQMRLRRYDRARVDGCWLHRDDVAQVTNDLLTMTYQERVANACIGKERADLVLAGCAILEEIREAFPAPRIRVADRGLREGILTQLIMDYQRKVAL